MRKPLWIVAPGLLLAFFILCFFAQPAQADNLVTIDVNASFAPESCGNCVYFPASGPVPTLYMTGQFTLDESACITGCTPTSWNMDFLGPAGATYQLSSQNGGTSSAVCHDLPSCPASDTLGWWTFRFSDANAFISIETLYGSAAPFYVGETLQLCPAQVTKYGNTYAPLPPCQGTSSAGGAGVGAGAIYELPSGGQSSGILTVVSVVATPEPSSFGLMLIGIALVFVMRKRIGQGQQAQT